MSPDPVNDLRQPTPAPSREVMDTAWLSACCEFHRNNQIPPRKTRTHSHSWVWPMAAVASIGILCAILFTKPDPIQAPSPNLSHTTEIENVFQQGHQLFGDQLKAVSISGDQITWHLRDTPVQHTHPPQIVTLTLKHNKHPNTHLAAYTGTPINLELEGKQHELEFLPDTSGNVIAYGDEIYWESDSPSSPITHARFQNTSP